MMPTAVNFFPDIVISVPDMGDSITEGTLLSWEKYVGDSVNIDDIIAVIETDKVSVDVRATHPGVIMEAFAKADDNVDVGDALLRIDVQSSDAMADETVSSSKPTETMSATAEEPAHSSSTRVPSIKFLGKEGWRQQKTTLAVVDTPTPTVPAPTVPQVGVRFGDSPIVPVGSAMFGRLPMSDAEMDAVESGGAALVSL